MPDNPGQHRKDLSEYTVHMIGNAHIDPVWQWRWEEGRQEALDTCHAAVDRILDTPGFTFSRSSAAVYEWIERVDPELFDEIKRWVYRGRWCIVGGWWVQPDCNIPCGESLVRQGLYGQRYFLDRFERMAQTAYNVDTFGHAGTLPQIFAKQRMGQYCFFRPDPNEKDLPANLFQWQAPDGTSIIAARMPGHYGTGPDELEDRIYHAAEQTHKGFRDTMSFYGVGNHGGGPTKANIASIQKVNEDPDGPEAIFSTPDAFFDAIREDGHKLPVVGEELQYHSRGCYTSVSALKKHNRFSEAMLLRAEKLSALADHLIDLQYPAADLRGAWKRVLFNQFHDILAGTSIRPACDDAIHQYQQAEMLADRADRNARTAIAARIDTSGDGRPIVVYNALSWDRTEVIDLEVTWPNHDDRVHVVDDTGEAVPFQVNHTNISGRGTTISLVFLAQVPACGYRTYRVLQGPGPDWDNPFAAGPTFIESDLYRLEFEEVTGWLTRLLDKSLDANILAAPANVPIVIDDPADTWAHGIDAFDREKGRFAADAGIDVAEIGPVRARIHIPMIYGDSTLIQDIRVSRSVPRIDVRLTVDYHGRHEFLKIAFPTNLDDPEATYEVPYGFAVRPADGTEQPAQKWADISGHLSGGDTAGLAVLNDCKYGYDADGAELRLSVLRTPIYCFHDPAVPDPRNRYEYTDQGPQTLTYSILPHSGDWREGDVVRHAQGLNHPCPAREEPAHAGDLPMTDGLIDIDAENVIVEAIKQHEDGDGYILRAYEAHGRETQTQLRFADIDPIHIIFAPCEIKTLLAAEGEITEVDMLEMPPEWPPSLPQLAARTNPRCRDDRVP